MLKYSWVSNVFSRFPLEFLQIPKMGSIGISLLPKLNKISMSYISIDCTLQLQSTRKYLLSKYFIENSSKMCLRNETKYWCVFTLTAKSDFQSIGGFFIYYILNFITKSIKYKDFHNLTFYMESNFIPEVENCGISCPTRKVLCLPKII